MDRVKVDLEHCYGIKSLKYEFDFTTRRAYAIYAPNGVMKSSFARTFRDIAEGEKTEDRIFPGRKNKRDVTDQAGSPIHSKSVLVVEPYDEELRPTEKTCVLLVNESLRKRFESVSKAAETAEEQLLIRFSSRSS